MLLLLINIGELPKIRNGSAILLGESNIIFTLMKNIFLYY